MLRLTTRWTEGLTKGLTKGLSAVASGLLISVTAHAQNTAGTPTDLSLYITQQCKPLSQGGRCRLLFVQVPAGLTPTSEVSQTCAPGWLAHVTAERGTVEKGGVNRGQAVVCGHTEAEAAIRAAMVSCDEQTFGICQDADYINIQWAFWSGQGDALTRLPMDEPLNLERLPQAQQCASAVPLVESASCQPAAAVLLRQSGLR